MTYEIIKNGIDEVIKWTDTNGIVRFIPLDPANSDYQAYLNPDKVEHLTEIIPSEAKTK